MPRNHKTISWLNVVCFLLVTSVAVSAVVLAPILAHQLQTQNQERKEFISSSIALDRADISDCSLGYPEMGELIDRSVPGPSRLSATIWPSFQAPWGIRLVGDDIYLVKLTSGYWPIPPPPEPGTRSNIRPAVTTEVHHASLTPAAAHALARLFSVRTTQADQEDTLGLDGVTYYFSSGPYCARTWSPEPESGAGRMVQLVDLLAKHAQMTDQRELAVSEREMATLVKSFRYSLR